MEPLCSFQEEPAWGQALKVVGKKDELTYANLAWHTQAGEGQGQLIGLEHFTTDKAAFPYGAHFAQVAVNKRTRAI